MNIELDAIEARVLGCLLEKARLTPDQYPLTLNALVNACNQKTSRDPVLSLDPGTVQRTARRLAERHLVTRHENFRSGIEKFEQALCNTTFGQLQFSAAEYAVLCLLLLRGAQTPGELRARSGRLHEFADNEAVRAVLQSLSEREDGPFVARLPRTPGRQDSTWMHLFCGPVAKADSDPEAGPRAAAGMPAEPPAPPASPGTAHSDRLGELEQRVAELEEAVAALSARLR
ncbi:MAG: DUF480 domain-containing protein [Gammaproteobacteria bacterium]|nr:MAG: DUF480 domain-containing protein [Gammaproteobacteria bacterium]